ncbi:hypothetical protein OEZ86_004914 [Tetradesmus obliquus]|nr:hypothetical protein OEZ86_004914 [Tetradesmus obliquus]
MSKVAFSLTIPAMLLASTTRTLANTQAANLIAIPCIAVAQIALGALFGRWAAAAVEGRLPITRLLLRWGDLHPTPSAAAISASTAAALRAPAAAPALLPRSQGTPQGLLQLTRLACAFGNTVALPLVYLAGARLAACMCGPVY